MPNMMNFRSYRAAHRSTTGLTTAIAIAALSLLIFLHPTAAQADCCEGMRGNIDCSTDNLVDIGDLTALIDYLYIQQTPLCCRNEANVDNDESGFIDIGDLTELIGYLYNNGVSVSMCQNAVGTFSGGTSCKSMVASRTPSDTTGDFGCIEYNYDESYKLTIKHVNAGFNCCPVLLATVNIHDSVITIQEVDSLFNGGCRCLCLFDMDYEITNLQPGIYHLTVIEPYLHQDDPPLEFELDLRGPTKGIYCEPRAYYPWGVYE
jgi:hypothetical protein